MSDIAAKLIWNGGLKFTGASQSGVETAIDGERQTGASPMELLLEAVGACSAIDVVVILEKQRTPLTKFEISLEGDRQTTDPRYYTVARVSFDLWGDDLRPEKVERAISLSLAKYCSVFHSLRPDLNLQAQFRIHDASETAPGNYLAVKPEAHSPGVD